MIVEKETRPMPPHQGQALKGLFMFHHIFWSFRPCIDGFQYCKTVVQVDGKWLYCKYKGIFLVAVARDGNNKIHPIVFAVARSESMGTWLFFLQNLKWHVTHNMVCV